METADVDAYTNASYRVVQKLNQLLEPLGKHYDQFSSEIWMPEETEYLSFFDGYRVSVTIAKEEYILISKALKALELNRMLLVEYISRGPSQLFVDLTKKYGISFDSILGEYDGRGYRKNHRTC